MYSVTEEELYTLRAIGQVLAFAFFGICAGIAGSSYLTLQTVGLSATGHAAVQAMFVAFCILSVVLLIASVVSYWRLNRAIHRVRARRLSPGGPGD